MSTFIKRAHQEITASIRSPPENNSDHQEPTRKEQHPSRACEEITMTIQGPPGNNSNHLEPIKGNGNASRAHQVPFTTPLPVDHLLEKLFKYLTRCGRGANTPPPSLWWGHVLFHTVPFVCRSPRSTPAASQSEKHRISRIKQCLHHSHRFSLMCYEWLLSLL